MNVGSIFLIAQAFFVIREFTLEKDLISALNVADLLLLKHISMIITEFTLEKAYECSECGRTVKQKQCCFIHWKVHTREKPCECQEYVKSFTRRCCMIKYQRDHTGEMALWILQILLAVMLKKFEVVTVVRTSGANGPFLERKQA